MFEQSPFTAKKVKSGPLHEKVSAPVVIEEDLPETELSIRFAPEDKVFHEMYGEGMVDRELPNKTFSCLFGKSRRSVADWELSHLPKVADE